MYRECSFKKYLVTESFMWRKDDEIGSIFKLGSSHNKVQE